jgi:hypothetical protein
MTEESKRLTQAGIVSLEAWLVWEGEQTQFYSTVYHLTVTKVLCFQEGRERVEWSLCRRRELLYVMDEVKFHGVLLTVL